MTALQRFAALTPRHDDVADVVQELEHLWGEGVRVPELAESLGLPPELVRNYLVELDAAGVILWSELTATAFSFPAVPILGTIS